MTFEPDFKEALQALPEKEKDKLILRLLKKDIKLAKRLHFELVENASIEVKRDQFSQEMLKRIELASKSLYSFGDLLMELRAISGKITEYLFITKDKYGEASLNCLMIRHFLELNTKRISTGTRGKTYTLSIYIIARVFKLLLLIQKQHEDLHLDFRNDIQEIGQLIGNNPVLMHLAIHNGLDVNWLNDFNIPDNLDEIQKELRMKGFLK
jgi:hypothetical protein